MYSSDFFVYNPCSPGYEVARAPDTFVDYKFYGVLDFSSIPTPKWCRSLIYLHFFMTALDYLQSLWSSFFGFSKALISHSSCLNVRPIFISCLKIQCPKHFYDVHFYLVSKICCSSLLLSLLPRSLPAKNYNLSDIEWESWRREDEWCARRGYIIHFSSGAENSVRRESINNHCVLIYIANKLPCSSRRNM